MAASSDLKNPDQPDEAKEDAAAEKRFIEQYKELSGASESQARSVYMYADIIRQRDPYCYRFE
jgi:hypothetical protein